jgi:ferredoxin
MNFDIFISYPNQDKAVADAACAQLEAHGIRCWIAPRDLAPGTNWPAAIVDAIDRCRAMVVIFSSSTNASKQVHREVQRAFDREVPVVPFRIENVSPEATLAFFMGSVHWLDALTPPLEQHLQKLVATVKPFARMASFGAREAEGRKHKAPQERNEYGSHSRQEMHEKQEQESLAGWKAGLISKRWRRRIAASLLSAMLLGGAGLFAFYVTHQARLARQEEETYRAAQNDPVRLRAYALGCALCKFRDEAVRRADLLEQLASVGTDRAALERFVAACGPTCPLDLKSKAEDRIAVAKAELARQEEETYRAAQNDPVRLRAYALGCALCRFRDEALRSADLLEQLASAGSDRAALERFVVTCGPTCPVDLKSKAEDRIAVTKADLARREEETYRAAQNDQVRLHAYAHGCALCKFRDEALRRADLLEQLASAGSDPAALERFVAACGPKCPVDLKSKAEDRVKASISGRN